MNDKSSGDSTASKQSRGWGCIRSLVIVFVVLVFVIIASNPLSQLEDVFFEQYQKDITKYEQEFSICPSENSNSCTKRDDIRIFEESFFEALKSHSEISIDLYFQRHLGNVPSSHSDILGFRGSSLIETEFVELFRRSSKHPEFNLNFIKLQEKKDIKRLMPIAKLFPKLQKALLGNQCRERISKYRMAQLSPGIADSQPIIISILVTALTKYLSIVGSDSQFESASQILAIFQKSLIHLTPTSSWEPTMGFNSEAFQFTFVVSRIIEDILTNESFSRQELKSIQTQLLASKTINLGDCLRGLTILRQTQCAFIAGKIKPPKNTSLTTIEHNTKVMGLDVGPVSVFSENRNVRLNNLILWRRLRKLNHLARQDLSANELIGSLDQSSSIYNDFECFKSFQFELDQLESVNITFKIFPIIIEYVLLCRFNTGDVNFDVELEKIRNSIEEVIKGDRIEYEVNRKQFYVCSKAPRKFLRDGLLMDSVPPELWFYKPVFLQVNSSDLKR